MYPELDINIIHDSGAFQPRTMMDLSHQRPPVPVILAETSFVPQPIPQHLILSVVYSSPGSSLNRPGPPGATLQLQDASTEVSQDDSAITTATFKLQLGLEIFVLCVCQVVCAHQGPLKKGRTSTEAVGNGHGSGGRLERIVIVRAGRKGLRRPSRKQGQQLWKQLVGLSCFFRGPSVEMNGLELVEGAKEPVRVLG
jgi:hypothetical protein